MPSRRASISILKSGLSGCWSIVNGSYLLPRTPPFWPGTTTPVVVAIRSGNATNDGKLRLAGTQLAEDRAQMRQIVRRRAEVLRAQPMLVPGEHPVRAGRVVVVGVRDGADERDLVHLARDCGSSSLI